MAEVSVIAQAPTLVEVLPSADPAIVEVTTAAPPVVEIATEGPQGPRGVAGADAQPLRIDASLASTWILSHGLGRVPSVQVFLSGGEAVLTDVIATDTQITVTFPTPQQGFVLAI